MSTKYIIGAGIVVIVLAGALFILQLWFSLFDAEIFSKLIGTLAIVGVTLFLGGLLYHEYSANKRDKENNLLG
jgi:hypothetical protein